MPEEDAERDRDQHLDIEQLEPRAEAATAARLGDEPVINHGFRHDSPVSQC